MQKILVQVQKFFGNNLFPIIFFFSLFIFLVHTLITKSAVYSDGRFYFAYTRSIVKDSDIKLDNDYSLLGIKPAINEGGFAVNTFSPGTSLFWIPLYWLTDKLISEPSGIGIPYQFSCAISSTVLGILGLYLLFRLLCKYFNKTISLLAVLSLFLTTNLFFYVAVEPINSHAASFFMSALIVYYLLKKENSLLKKEKPLLKSEQKLFLKDAFILGILSGIAGLVRTQDALIITVPMLKLFLDHKTQTKYLVTGYLLLATGFIFAFSPQIFLWKLFFNFYFPPPGWGYGFSFFSPHIFYVLFNLHNGLFVFTPITLISLVGLFVFKNQNKKLAFLSLFYFFLQLYFISSWQEYFQGGSYSIRMIITTYPLLAFGLATVIKNFLAKGGLYPTLLAIGTLASLNMLLIVVYLLIF